MLAFDPPVTPVARPSQVTLPAESIDRIGAEAAWAAVRDQTIHRVSVMDGCVFSYPEFVRQVTDSEHDPGILIHLADDNPELVRRVAWTPDELVVAQALLDRAYGLSLGGPEVRPEEVTFWAGGRLPTVVLDGAGVPLATFGWLATGDWDGDVPGAEPGVRTDDRGSQIRTDPQGRVHSADGPAVIMVNGSIEWRVRGERHRVDGPAVVWSDGTQGWYLNGEQHREDGPARILPDGTRRWYLNGIGQRMR